MNILNNLDKNSFEQNKVMCRLLSIHFKDFFDNIYIPLKYFKNGGWDIRKILYDNEDVLFYNKKYMTLKDKEFFDKIFTKYVLMIEDIINSENNLYKYLKKWTNISTTKWKSNDNGSYLKSILTNKNYKYISPAYITNVYIELTKKYSEGENITTPKDLVQNIKTELKNCLDTIIKEAKNEIDKFKKRYHEIVLSYVCERPGHGPYDVYVNRFINNVIMAIIELTEKLINLNIYIIHPLVINIINSYMPLDDINQYKPSEYGGREIYIV